MWSEVVTLVTLAILWGRFEAVFLTTEAPRDRSQRTEVRGQGSGQKMFSREGMFSSVPGVQSVPSQCFRAFLQFQSVPAPPSLVRFEKRIWANVCRAWHGGTLWKNGC